MRRTATILAAATAMMLAAMPIAAASPAPERHHAAPSNAQVTVGGAVADPASYTAADLRALPQTTLPLAGRHRHDGGTVTGVSLIDLIALSDPQFGTGKNAQLRARLTVTGRHGAITFAYGELDASFGNHPALLTTTRSAIDLVVPGDRTRLRSLSSVESVSVAVSNAEPVTPPKAGSIQLTTGRHTVTLSGWLLSLLPRHTITVSYLAGTAAQQHTESGPSLAWVLLAAGVLPGPNTAVTAVGSDGYAATVTIGEDLLGGRPLLLSLAEDGVALEQPRLIIAGDVKGGRYVSGVVTLAVENRR